MSQPPASSSVSMSKALAATTSDSSSNIGRIFDAALKSYNKKAKKDIKNHGLFKQLEKCDSPAAILTVFQDTQFKTGSGERLRKWLVPTLNVLCAFTNALGEGVSLAFSPAKVIFAGAGVLLSAAKDVAASQDILIDTFGRIESFFVRLEIYTGVPLTPTMTDKMVQITVEVLGVLASATKEMEQSRAKKFLKRVVGRTDLEDGLKKLEKLTNEEIAMATVQTLKVAHDIDAKVTEVDAAVGNIDENVLLVKSEVQFVKSEVRLVNDNVTAIEDKVQTMADDGEANAKEVKLVLQQTVEGVDDVKRNLLLESLRKWQSPPDPSINHHIASDRQHEGTAEWFIESDKCHEWMAAGSLLWIHGKPGSGKSILCSAIINDVKALCDAGLASMAYFYFDFRDVDKQARRNLLSSLLVQLSSRSDAYCDVLSRLYESHEKGAHQPSNKALTQCLKEMLTLPNQGTVYLIMDALDECPDTSDVPSPREQVLDLVKDLVHLRLPSLYICVTSRPEVDIRDALGSLASETVSLQDELGQKKDIADYVRSVVHRGSGKFMRRWRKEDKEDVIETLSERADGMFRWVFCQLEMLRNCLPQNVRRALRELPSTLDETYERMLWDILKANPDQAYRLLQCLTVAVRPLRVNELAEVLALNFDETEGGIPVLNKDWKWDDEEQGVLSTCSSLVVIVDDDNYPRTRVVQFAHFSVKEFLTSDRLSNLKADISRFHIRLEPAHTVVAQACMAILLSSDDNDLASRDPTDLPRSPSESPRSVYSMYNPEKPWDPWADHAQFENVADSDSTDLPRSPYKSPLSKYIMEHWVGHAQFENVSSHIEDGMRCLFNPAKPHFAAWLSRSFNFRPYLVKPFFRGDSLDTILMKRDCPLESTSASEDNAPCCLYYAALYGFRDLTKYLIHKYPQHVNATVDLDGRPTPLAAALSNGHVQVAELLLQHGAVLHIGYQGRTLLHAASKDGLIDVTQWLLEHSVDANVQDDDHSTPLHWAARYGRLELVRTLLEHGGDVNATTALDNHTPLHKASEGGHFEVVQLLIQNGADVTTDLQGLLLLALSSGSAETVQLFIELGADVNARNESDWTALHLASCRGQTEIMQILIKHGALVNARDGSYRTPLHLMSSIGILDPEPLAETMKVLIENGADASARDQNQSTPLHIALLSSPFRTFIIPLLIEGGADLNARDQNQSTPLQIALPFGGPIARQLIEGGADVNVRDQNQSTPLHIALTLPWSADPIVPLLIERGADVSARDQNHSTPLHMASSSEALDAETIVRLLIENGGDVHARDQNQSTPLHIASARLVRSRTDTAIVRVLIEHGADVSARDQNQFTPLHLALRTWSPFAEPTARLLIERGADVSARDPNHSTPLHMALRRWSPFAEPIVRLLIERGADVSARYQNHSTPLHMASSFESYNTETIVRLLSENGADVHARDQNQSTPLHIASSVSSSKVVHALIEHGADVSARDQNQSTPLHMALANKTSSGQQIVRLLIENGADVHAWDQNLSTPLHVASLADSSNVVHALIEHGADVSARDQNQSTPLHIASVNNTSSGQQIVRLLIENGGDVHALDQNQSTPLHMASANKTRSDEQIVRLLIENGADVHARDQNQSTPLHIASSASSSNVVDVLTEHGADVIARDQNQSTPLHMASVNYTSSGRQIVRLLIANGGDVHARDQNQSTPLHIASSSEIGGSMVRLLIEHGADVSARDQNQSTPLHIASANISRNGGEIAHLLIEHGADIHARDQNQLTPWDIARSSDSWQVLDLVFEHGATATYRPLSSFYLESSRSVAGADSDVASDVDSDVEAGDI